MDKRLNKLEAGDKRLKGLKIGWRLAKLKRNPVNDHVCKKCGKKFYRSHSKGRGKFCSKECQYSWWSGKKMPRKKPYVSKKIKRECLMCGKVFYGYFSGTHSTHGKYCSTKCRYSDPNFAKRGKEHYCWKGGRMTLSGYVYILSPNHPNKNSGGYVAEHRLIMEKYIGRYLTKHEDVHHINKIKNDNRIKNLQIVSHKDHRGNIICPHCGKDVVCK